MSILLQKEKLVVRSCLICILQTKSARSKGFDSWDGLKRHLERAHEADFRDFRTGLTYDCVLNVIKKELESQ